MDAIFEGEGPRARLALLLQHFSHLEDSREPWRIVYPLKEVLLLVTCATIASCDDFDDIVAWGKHHLHFLRQFEIPSRHSMRALAAQPHQPDRSGLVCPLLQQLDRVVVAEAARSHHHRRQEGAPNP